jgi:invasion protein IalB
MLNPVLPLLAELWAREACHCQSLLLATPLNLQLARLLTMRMDSGKGREYTTPICYDANTGEQFQMKRESGNGDSGAALQFPDSR